MLGEEALGMELHPLDGELAVAQTHQLAAIDRPGGGDQALRETLIHHQAVVPCRGEGRRHAGEDAMPVVTDLGGLAMHEPGSALDHPAEGLADRLVPQAHPEQGRAALRCGTDQLQADARLGRGARTGRNHQMVRLLGHDRGDGALVIAVDLHRGAQLPEILDEVVSEAVVIVDDDDHGRAEA